MLNQYIESGDVDFIAQCIKNREAQLSQPDYNGNTPIHLASALGQEKILTLLLSADAQKCDVHVDARAAYTQATPLHFASRNGRQSSITLLLENGADPNAKDNKGWSPIHYAVFRNHSSIVEQLIAKGGDVNARTGDGTGYTPLHLACYCGIPEIVALLIRNGADFCSKDDKGNMPFDLLPLVKPKKESEEPKHHKASGAGHSNSSNSRRKSTSGSSSAAAAAATDEMVEEEYANALRDAVKKSYKRYREDVFSEDAGITPQFADFSIKFANDETVFRCHKAILAARSPLLRAELEANPELEEHTVGNGFEPAAFRMFLEWCYTGAVGKLSVPLAKADIPSIIQLIPISYAYVVQESAAVAAAAQVDGGKPAPCILPELCISAIAENFAQEFLPVIIDEMLRYDSNKLMERLGAATLGAMLGLPESDSIAQGYELFKKLPKETMEGIVLSLNVMPREVKTAPRVDHGAQVQLAELASPTAGATPVGAAPAEVKEEEQLPQEEEKANEPFVEIFTLEFAQTCPPEFKRKIKATNTKVNSAVFSYMLSDKNMLTCREILASLREIQNPGWFELPVPDSQDYAPKYYEIIKKPMDLGTLEVILYPYSFIFAFHISHYFHFL